MKAVILVGGKATRLRPLTRNTPKAVVPVLNTPFLEHVIRHLEKHRIRDIILAQSHLTQPIENYFGNGSQFGVRLYYSVEDSPLGTGGAVKNAENYLDETFLVLNGDIFTDLDITAMLDTHKGRKAKLTIARTPVNDATGYGLIETDARGKITRFLEKPGPDEITANMINAGTYILEPEVLAQIPPQTNFSIEHELFATLPNPRIPAWVYDYSTYWIDIGTPEKYLQLHRDLLASKSSQHAPEEVQIGKQSYIHPTAQIKGPAVIGDNCSIGPNVKLIGPVVIGNGCKIQEGTVVEKSIIWQNSQLGQRVTLRNSVVANNCYLNDDGIIEDSALGDNVTTTSGYRLEPGTQSVPQVARPQQQNSTIP